AAGLAHPIRVVPAAEGHRVEGEPADRDLAAEMIGVRADLPDVVDTHVTDQKVRPRILGAARLEHRELERELAREYLGRDLGVDPDGGHGPLSIETLAHDPIESLDEIGYAIDRHGESGAHRAHHTA